MKNDCDEAGLEYELLLQGPQGPRYLRDLNEYYTNNEEKPDHIILLKHKRQNNETTVSPTDDPIVGNAQETTATAGVIITSTTAATKKAVFDFLLGNPQPAPALPNIQKVLLVLRERLAARRAPKPTTAPPPPTHAPIVAPKINHHHFVLPTLPQLKFTSKAPTKAPTKAPAPRTLFNKELVIERKVSLPVLPEHLRVRN